MRNIFVRYLIVGLLGTGLNLVVFYMLSDKLGVNHNVASVAAFVIAVTQNYVINELWSFSRDTRRHLHWKRYTLYFSGNLLGLTVNIIILNSLIAISTWKLKTIPQAIGIAGATLVNYIWAKKMVFQRQNNSNEIEY